MRIVAGHTTDARIRAIEASAVGQPVWLKAHVGLSSPMGAYNGLPAAVALPAEIRNVL
jgi:hypothetical protein